MKRNKTSRKIQKNHHKTQKITIFTLSVVERQPKFNTEDCEFLLGNVY